MKGRPAAGFTHHLCPHLPRESNPIAREVSPMKNRLLFPAAIMLLGLLAAPALAWYPSTETVELGTATW
jgi:hypothetical protein